MASSFHFHGTMGRRRMGIADVFQSTNLRRSTSNESENGNSIASNSVCFQDCASGAETPATVAADCPADSVPSNKEQAEAQRESSRKAMSRGSLEVQEIIASESENMKTGSNGMTHGSKPPSLDTRASNPTLHSGLASILQVSRGRRDGEARRRKEGGVKKIEGEGWVRRTKEWGGGNAQGMEETWPSPKSLCPRFLLFCTYIYSL